MYFGSDEEKVITTSIQDVFPSATRRLYSKHSVVDRILSGCDGVHVQMTGFLASFASHSTQNFQSWPFLRDHTCLQVPSSCKEGHKRPTNIYRTSSSTQG
jgi:hypothetical protein